MPIVASSLSDCKPLVPIPPVPPRVRVLSAWQPHAGALFEPRRGWQKSIEMSTAPWPEPSWAVIHAPERVDTVALERLGLTLHEAEPRGALLGLVWIAESRPLTPDDAVQSGFYKADRFALVVQCAQPFPEAILWWMPTGRRLGMVDRHVVLGALEGATVEHGRLGGLGTIEHTLLFG